VVFGALIRCWRAGAVLGWRVPRTVDRCCGRAALAAFIAYRLCIAGPLKVARRVCYRGLGQRGWVGFVFICWMGSYWVAGDLVGLLWLGVRYLPQFARRRFQSVPAAQPHQPQMDIRNVVE